MELDYQEFLSLLSCLMGDTPLGQIIAVRSEKDPELIKSFTAEQRQIRKEWLNMKQNDKGRQEYAEVIDQLFHMALA